MEILIHSFTETKWRHFQHYVFRWFAVPRRTQRVIRYFGIVVFLIYTVLGISLPDFYSSVRYGAWIHALLGLLLLSPFINALVSAVRLQTVSYTLEVDAASQVLTVRNAGIESKIEMSRVKNLFIRPSHVRVTLRTESFDQYLYFLLFNLL